MNSFLQKFKNNKILDQSSLEDAVQVFNEEMEKTLDIIAPLEEKKKSKRQNKPWYTSQLLKQRKIVRNRERAYITYRENHHWKAFTREWNRYNRMLDYNKRHQLVTIINKANKDSKHIFKALNGILGNKNENPLLTGTTDRQLAEDFFLNKIDRIREEFTNMPVYQPKQLNTPKTSEIHTGNTKSTNKNNKSNAN